MAKTMQGVASMLAVALLLAAIPTGVQSIGVCYGVIGNNLPPASDVVQMYRANGFTNMRIYFNDTNALRAVSGTNIGVIMDIDNRNLAAFARDPNAAKTWVQNSVKAFPGVNFRYITVGNEVADSDGGKILPAMKNVNAALAAAGLSHIKASVAVHSGVTDGFPPSEGIFNSQAFSYMAPIAQYLATTGAPLLANIYPYFSFLGNQAQIDIEYALFTSPGTVVQDGDNAYQNLFDALVDTMYSALEDAGAGNVKIIVSESGWPSAGGDSANAATKANAQTYNQNLIRHVAQGTPKRPGPIETYIFAMFNENQKGGAPTEQHFGLFNPDKSPAYQINF